MVFHFQIILLRVSVMIPEFLTLKEMCMRKVLLEDLSREDLPYPVNKMIEGLERLPGDYTVTQSSLEIQDKGLPLSQGLKEVIEKMYKVEKGATIAISKVMSSDILWNIVVPHALFCGPIFGQPVYPAIGTAGMRSFIGGGEKEEEAEGKEKRNYTGKVEWEKKIGNGGWVGVGSQRIGDSWCSSNGRRTEACLEVDSKGKLVVILKWYLYWFEEGREEIEEAVAVANVLNVLVAQRD